MAGGCPLTLSTAAGQPLKCRVSAGEWQRSAANEVSVALSNTGAEARLRQLALVWPRQNGRLVAAWLGTTAIYIGGELPGPAGLADQDAGTRRAGDLAGGVAAPPVHDEDLDAGGPGALDRGADAVGLVECGDHDRELHPADDSMRPASD